MGGSETDSETDTERAVEEALTQVRNPSLGTNVYEAGIVRDLRVEDRTAVVALDETAIDPTMATWLRDAINNAVQSVDGVESVQLDRVETGTAPDGRTTAEGEEPSRTHASAPPTADGEPFDDAETVIAVASAKGGVGKSTIAVQLACAMAADRDVGVFDADIYGPNVPTLLDVDGPVRTTDEGNPQPVTVAGLEAMSVGFLTDDGPLAWRGSVAHDALSELLVETAWDARDVVVLDLPPGTGDVVLTILQEAAVDGVVFVTTPFQASVDDTRRSLTLFREEGVPVLGTVVNMASHTCPSCGDEHPLFESSTDPDLDVSVLAELPFDHEVQQTATPGETTPAFAELADRVSDRLAETTQLSVPDDAVDIRGLEPDARYDAVRDGFGPLDSGDSFTLVSDRDPSPVREFLADVADVSDPVTAFQPFDVERHDRETWVLRTVRP